MRIYYPIGDSRRSGQPYLPHESEVEILGHTEHTTIVKNTKTGEQHITHLDFIKTEDQVKKLKIKEKLDESIK